MCHTSKITASELVLSAVFFLQQRNGVTARDITKFICDKRGYKQCQVKDDVVKALEKATKKGIFCKSRGLYRIRSDFGEDMPVDKNKKDKERIKSKSKISDNNVNSNEDDLEAIEKKMENETFELDANCDDPKGSSPFRYKSRAIYDSDSEIDGGPNRKKISISKIKFKISSDEDDDEDFFEEDDEDDDDADFFSDEEPSQYSTCQQHNNNPNNDHESLTPRTTQKKQAYVKKSVPNKSKHKSKSKKRKSSKPRKKLTKRRKTAPNNDYKRQTRSDEEISDFIDDEEKNKRALDRAPIRKTKRKKGTRRKSRVNRRTTQKVPAKSDNIINKEDNKTKDQKVDNKKPPQQSPDSQANTDKKNTSNIPQKNEESSQKQQFYVVPNPESPNTAEPEKKKSEKKPSLSKTPTVQLQGENKRTKKEFRRDFKIKPGCQHQQQFKYKTIRKSNARNSPY